MRYIAIRALDNVKYLILPIEENKIFKIVLSINAIFKSGEYYTVDKIQEMINENSLLFLKEMEVQYKKEYYSLLQDASLTSIQRSTTFVIDRPNLISDESFHVLTNQNDTEMLTFLKRIVFYIDPRINAVKVSDTNLYTPFENTKAGIKCYFSSQDLKLANSSANPKYLTFIGYGKFIHLLNLFSFNDLSFKSFVRNFDQSIIEALRFSPSYVKREISKISELSGFATKFLYTITHFFNFDGFIMHHASSGIPEIYINNSNNSFNFQLYGDQDEQPAKRTIFSYVNIEMDEKLRLSQKRFIFGAKETSVQFVKGSVKWEMNSCYFDSLIILLLFMKYDYYIERIINADVWKQNYLRFVKMCSSTSSSFLFKGSDDEKLEMEFKKYATEVQHAIRIMFDSIQQKKQTSCTQIRKALSLCHFGSELSHLKYDGISKKKWKIFFSTLLPKASKEDINTLSFNINPKMVSFGRSYDVVQKYSRKSVSSEPNEEVIKATVDYFVDAALLPPEQSVRNTIVKNILLFLNSERKPQAGDPVDVYALFGIIFPDIRMNYFQAAFGNQNEPMLDATESFCDTNSRFIVSDDSLAKNEMIVFSNLLRNNVLVKSETIKRPLHLTLNINYRKFILVGVVFLEKKKKKYEQGEDDDKIAHYVSSFIAKDGSWVRFNNTSNVFASSFYNISLSKNMDEQEKQIMSPKENEIPVLFFYYRL